MNKREAAELAAAAERADLEKLLDRALTLARRIEDVDFDDDGFDDEAQRAFNDDTEDLVAAVRGLNQAIVYSGRLPEKWAKPVEKRMEAARAKPRPRAQSAGRKASA